MKKLLLIWVMIMTVSSSLFAQTRQVTGKVTSSEDGAALPGVSVSLKGSSRGTTTAAAGTYKISVGDGAAITFSFVGYKPQTVSVGNQNAINVVLASDASELNEVVVTALGLTRTKNSLPYAAQQIKGEELTRVRTGNAFSQLSGKVSGVQITQGNAIGGSTNVVIRGSKSLTGNNQALFVVDGVPIDNTNFGTNPGNSSADGSIGVRGGGNTSVMLFSIILISVSKIWFQLTHGLDSFPLLRFMAIMTVSGLQKIQKRNMRRVPR